MKERIEGGTVRLDVSVDKTEVRWDGPTGPVTKTFPRPIQTATYIAEPPSVLVVEGMAEGVRDNAVVLNPDGSERVRLIPPTSGPARGFYQAYMSVRTLVVVYTTFQMDLWGQPDLETGVLSGDEGPGVGSC